MESLACPCSSSDLSSAQPSEQGSPQSNARLLGLCRLNLTTETYLLMASLIETALELLTSAAVESGRRWAGSGLLSSSMTVGCTTS